MAQPLSGTSEYVKYKALRLRLKGAYTKYVSEAECRKQRSNLRMMTHRLDL
ncbi:hypothetical protein [Porphyromonas macacae]|uniref:hypothetical protein n=1 Tax=Porphyromonas macacae TaxID=28115 RepID=UPI0016516110|nr:hypothetical protein [Porphyromonas macacae]